MAVPIRSGFSRPEGWGFENSEADTKADLDHDDADEEHERDPQPRNWSPHALVPVEQPEDVPEPVVLLPLKA